MLYFDRISISEGTDVNKTGASKKSLIFVTIGFFHIIVFLNYSNQMSVTDVMIY